jgi:hypothetical protein
MILQKFFLLLKLFYLYLTVYDKYIYYKNTLVIEKHIKNDHEIKNYSVLKLKFLDVNISIDYNIRNTHHLTRLAKFDFLLNTISKMKEKIQFLICLMYDVFILCLATKCIFNNKLLTPLILLLDNGLRIYNLIQLEFAKLDIINDEQAVYIVKKVLVTILPAYYDPSFKTIFNLLYRIYSEFYMLCVNGLAMFVQLIVCACALLLNIIDIEETAKEYGEDKCVPKPAGRIVENTKED